MGAGASAADVGWRKVEREIIGLSSVLKTSASATDYTEKIIPPELIYHFVVPTETINSLALDISEAQRKQWGINRLYP